MSIRPLPRDSLTESQVKCRSERERRWNGDPRHRTLSVLRKAAARKPLEVYRRRSTRADDAHALTDSPEPPGKLPGGSENGEGDDAKPLRVGETAVMASRRAREGRPSLRAFRYPSRCRMRRAPTNCSRRWRTAGRCNAVGQDVLVATVRHVGTDQLGVGWMIGVPREAMDGRVRPARGARPMTDDRSKLSPKSPASGAAG